MKAVIALFVTLTLVAAPAGAVAAPVQSASTQAPATTGTVEPTTNETIGYVNGYWHDDELDIDQSNGLTDEEVDAYVARAMARVEYIRGVTFKSDVSFSVVSRDKFRQHIQSQQQSQEYSEWDNKIWKALFIVGSDTDAGDERGKLQAEAVLGFYSASNDQIVIISDSTDRPVIDNATLVHELAHALQDQQYDLTHPRYSGNTHDESLAVNGLVEGEAAYIEEQYTERCGDEWNCVETPERAKPDSSELNRGIWAVSIHPYSDGPAYIHSIRNQDGWAGVESLHENPPKSTAQIIHGETPPRNPVTFEDEARNGWALFDSREDASYTTLGEASIHTMFWYQSSEHDINVINSDQFNETNEPYSQYDFVSDPSDGWVDDRLYPYRNGGDRGYVWKTNWESAEDAEEFRDAYTQIIEGHGGTEGSSGVWTVEDGGYEGAYHVEQNGQTVTIVHGPSTDSLTDIKPSAAVTEKPTAPVGVQ